MFEKEDLWFHYLVRFLCAEFDIGSVDVAITDSPHSQWLVRFVSMDLVSREVRRGYKEGRTIRLFNLCYLL